MWTVTCKQPKQRLLLIFSKDCNKTKASGVWYCQKIRSAWNPEFERQLHNFQPPETVLKSYFEKINLDGSKIKLEVDYNNLTSWNTGDQTLQVSTSCEIFCARFSICAWPKIKNIPSFILLIALNKQTLPIIEYR